MFLKKNKKHKKSQTNKNKPSREQSRDVTVKNNNNANKNSFVSDWRGMTGSLLFSWQGKSNSNSRPHVLCGALHLQLAAGVLLPAV